MLGCYPDDYQSNKIKTSIKVISGPNTNEHMMTILCHQIHSKFKKLALSTTSISIFSTSKCNLPKKLSTNQRYELYDIPNRRFLCMHTIPIEQETGCS